MNNIRRRECAAGAFHVLENRVFRNERQYDELQSDQLGVRFMADAGYDPRSMIRVMEILQQASRGPRPPEFFSTHPNSEHRISGIEAAIRQQFPKGVPPGLEK